MFGAQADAQSVVHGLAVRHGNVDVAPPTRHGLNVAPLQAHDDLPGPVGEGRIRLKPGARFGVEALQVRELLGILSAIDQVRHEAAESGAPIANMILPEHFAAQRLEHPGHRVADDGAAQVVDLHLFRQIRVRIVHDHPRRRREWLQQRPGERRGKPFVRDGETDEAGAGDFGVGKAVEVSAIDHPLRQLPGFDAKALGRCHGAVGLIVAELRTSGRGNNGGGAGGTGSSERGVQAGG